MPETRVYDGIDRTPPPLLWYQKPLGIVALTVIGVVIGGGILKALGWI